MMGDKERIVLKEIVILLESLDRAEQERVLTHLKIGYPLHGRALRDFLDARPPQDLPPIPFRVPSSRRVKPPGEKH